MCDDSIIQYSAVHFSALQYTHLSNLQMYIMLPLMQTYLVCVFVKCIHIHVHIHSHLRICCTHKRTHVLYLIVSQDLINKFFQLFNLTSSYYYDAACYQSLDPSVELDKQKKFKKENIRNYEK